MSVVAGQARGGSRLLTVLGLIGRALLAVLIVGVGLLVAGGVRLARGPVDITWFARYLAGRRHDDGTRWSVRRAELAWDRHAPQWPLVVTLDGAAMRRPDGSTAASAGRVSAALLPATLLIGRAEPLSIRLDDASVALLHERGGGWKLDTGHIGPVSSLAWTQQLRAVHVRTAAVFVTDQMLSTTWRVNVAAFETGKSAGSTAWSGHVEATLAQGGQSSHVAAALTPGKGSGSVLDGRWSAFDPARMHLPTLSAEALPDVPVAGTFRANLAADGSPRRADVTLVIGAGRIGAGGIKMRLVAGGATLAADFADRKVRIKAAQLVLPAGADGRTPLLHLAGTMGWGQQQNGAALKFDLDRVLLADLARDWPDGVAVGARNWIAANVVAGVARDGHFDLALAMKQGRVVLTAASGHMAADDLTLSWLRPVPPLIHASGVLTLSSPDALSIEVGEATQSPSDLSSRPLALRRASLRITGLAAPVQVAALEGDVEGEVTQTLALLREKRLRLLAAHPIDLGAVAGNLSAHVTVRLPLESTVTIEQVGVGATGRLTALHMGGAIAGRDLDLGDLALNVSNDGLKLTGTAQVAGIPSRLTATMDFRAGSADQVVTRIVASGVASIAQLTAAGLATGGAEGAVDYTASLADRRDGEGRAEVHLDLRGVGIGLSALGWQKRPDSEGAADAVMLLNHDRVAGIDRLEVHGPGVEVQARGTRGPAGWSLNFERIAIGGTIAAGTVVLPSGGTGPVQGDLHGAMLDLSGVSRPDPDRPTLGRAEAQAAARQRRSVAARAASGPAGQPWRADLRFARVLLDGGRSILDVVAHAQYDGRRVRRASLNGRAGEGSFTMTLAPDGLNGRRVQGDARDAGALLRAFDLTDAVQGGHLTLDAGFDDRQVDGALVGIASIDGMRVVGAPAMARLLQAMTLYGVVDVLRGPGLGITHLIAPFHYADSVLTLDNARAFSGSLGFTSKGDIDIAAQRADLTGTIVPAYFFNTLLGKLPLLGKLFSPEQGGGVLSATYSLSGALGAPQVRVNPLAALTPGVLRGLFGIFDTAPTSDAGAPGAAATR